VDRSGKEFGKQTNELGREVRVEKKSQRAICSRPACEA
jgi:hypothetical protein